MNNIKYGYWFQETTDVRKVLIRINLTPIHGIKRFLSQSCPCINW